LSGQTVTVVEQGDHLDAIQKEWLKLISPDGAGGCQEHSRSGNVRRGVQDLAFLALKAYVIKKSRPK
jgi:hypothetical protein